MIHFPYLQENPQTAEDLLSTRKQAYVDGKEIELQFFDTTADEGHYDRLRPLAYPQTDIFIILFSVDVPDSLASVKSKVSAAICLRIRQMFIISIRFWKWFPELSHYCPRVPIILVGNKTDLRRTDEGTSPAHVSPEQGASVATEIGAKYIECSAKTGLGMQDVLDLTLREGMAGHTYRRYKRPCIHCVVA